MDLPLNLRMYNLFRKNLHLPEDQAQEFVQVIDEAVKEQGAHKHEQAHALVQKEIASFKEQGDSKYEMVDKDIQSLKGHMDDKFAYVDTKFTQIDTKFTQVDARFDQVDKEFRSLRDYVDGKFYESDKRMATKENLSETKSEIIKWMFIFWIGQVVATIGFLAVYLKK